MAGRPCSVCQHPDRQAIDMMLVNRKAFRAISRQFGLSKDAVLRHHDDHLPETLTQAREAEDVAHALDVVQQLKAINGACLAVLKDARQAGNGELVLKAVDRVQRQIELQAKLLGDLDDRPQINVLVSPQWLLVRSTLLEALRPYPEARTAVAARLMALGASA